MKLYKTFLISFSKFLSILLVLIGLYSCGSSQHYSYYSDGIYITRNDRKDIRDVNRTFSRGISGLEMDSYNFNQRILENDSTAYKAPDQESQNTYKPSIERVNYTVYMSVGDPYWNYYRPYRHYDYYGWSYYPYTYQSYSPWFYHNYGYYRPYHSDYFYNNHFYHRHRGVNSKTYGKRNTHSTTSLHRRSNTYVTSNHKRNLNNNRNKRVIYQSRNNTQRNTGYNTHRINSISRSNSNNSSQRSANYSTSNSSSSSTSSSGYSRPSRRSSSTYISSNAARRR